MSLKMLWKMCCGSLASRMLRQQRVSFAASLEPTVAATADRSCTSFEIGQSHSGLGSKHQEPRVGGTLGRALHAGSDGWRSPVPQGDNTGVRVFAPLPPTIPCRSRRLVQSFLTHLGQCTRWQLLYVQRMVSVRRCDVIVACCCGWGGQICPTLRHSCRCLLRQQQHECPDVAASITFSRFRCACTGR